ncbi:MAG: sulfatase [Hyphomicrobium sp.]
MTEVSRRTVVKTTAALAAMSMKPAFAGVEKPKRPNIVLFTLDDCDADSLGCFGCTLKGITPHLDALAARGMTFKYAHTNSSTCQPSRLSMMSGLDPQSLGLRGHVDPLPPGTPTLPAILRANGYYTGIIGKISHYPPKEAFNWSRSYKVGYENVAGAELSADVWDDSFDGYWSMWRVPQGFYHGTRQLVREAKSIDRPFFLHLNTSDPHRPWPGSLDEATWFRDPPFKAVNMPMRPYEKNYSPVEVPLPGYLPDLPGVRVDRAQYFSALHNGDKSFGRIVEALRSEGVYEDTVFICLSDQGASFPMSKQSLYHYATNLNLIIYWPGLAAGGTMNTNAMISIVDIMPTILDVLGIPQPAKIDGKSFARLFSDPSAEVRDVLFSSYNYARTGLQVYPMRSALTRRFQYIYNAWPGQTNLSPPTPLVYDGRIDPLSGLCWMSMKEAAKRDLAIRERVTFIRSRVNEEFYDLDADPYCLKNIVALPEHAEAVAALKSQLEAELVRFGDPILDIFRGNGAIPVAWLSRAPAKALPVVHD